MGTQTPNLNLYKPTPGEVGYGEEVNENFDTLDSTIITISGHLQGQLSDIVGESSNALIGSDGITVTSGTSTDTISGFYSEFVSASGVLQSDIDAIDNHSRYTDTEAATAARPELVTTSGHLQTQISQNAADIAAINVDEVEPAITGSDGITITSGTSTTDVAGFYSEFTSASGSLQSQIDAIDVDEADVSSLNSLQGDLIIEGADGITITDDAVDTITATGFRSEFVAASGSLQTQISDNTTLITTTSGHLQSQIGEQISENDNADRAFAFFIAGSM